MTPHVYADVEQRSDEWHDLRRGIVTASTVGRLINVNGPTGIDFNCPKCAAVAGSPCISGARKEPTPIKTIHTERASYANDHADEIEPTIDVADLETLEDVALLLAAERITETTDPSFVSADMIRGIEHEPYAREEYEKRTGSTVTECGFMVREFDGFKIGYSPDGLVDDDGLIEIKCPRSKEEIRTFLAGEAPAKYMPQLMAGLLVSGRAWIDFVSFVGGMPLYIKRITPDPRWFAAIERAAAALELSVEQTVNAYNNATTGLPPTERVPDLEEIY